MAQHCLELSDTTSSYSTSTNVSSVKSSNSTTVYGSKMSLGSDNKGDTANIAMVYCDKDGNLIIGG